jgi:DtxR family Mn-dependent transcriptional regulator
MPITVSRRSEDYLRTIYEISERKGYARIKDISEALGVRPSTAVEMVKKLCEQGLVNYERYGAITLTPQGKEIAQAVKKRHDVFKKFLELLLVPDDVAERDAHILEHQLHPKTVLQISRFVEFITWAMQSEHPRFIKIRVEEVLDEFRMYCKKHENNS